MQSEKQDLVIEAIKGSPAVAGAVASAMTMNEMVMLGTVI